MSLFEFVTVIISMVLALALGQLLLTAAALAKNRQQVTGYPAMYLWLATFFFMVLVVWWSQWDFRDLDWRYPSFFYVTLAPTLLFFAVALITPQRLGEEHVDLEAHFLSVRPLFLSVMLAYDLVGWLDGPLLQGQSMFGVLGAIHGVFTVCLVVGLSTRSRRVQTLIAALVLALHISVMIPRFLPGAFG